MSEATFSGSVPENYERYLVPLIFEDYAADLASRVSVPAGGKVLEVACGTGVVTRHVLAHLPADSHLTATDLQEAMIDQAKSSVGSSPRITYRQADAADLPFSDGSFEAVICQFGIMFLPDKSAGYSEAARVLKPGGVFAFNVWDSLERNGMARVVHDTLGDLFPADPPRFLEVPYGYYDLNEIKNALYASGFGGIDISVQPRTSEAASSREVALGYVAGSPLATQLADMGPPSESDVLDSVERAIADEFGAAPTSAPMEAFQITARRPK